MNCFYWHESNFNRFLRELRKLKQMADYSSVDSSNVAQVG